MSLPNDFWFDIAVMMSIFHIGNLFFGHFEAHKPAWKRLLKTALFLVFVLILSSLGLRSIAYWSIGIVGSLMFALVHGYWLPKNGVNGLTGEPKEKYYELIGHKQ
ncbi:MAG: hypothetical protein EAZ92_07150 [Candidatus Kapaibacterium sp.]|nr:MAG: hypothetical protein EAZ92_07150 [Candidatus Kapabacteria bacterium]